MEHISKVIYLWIEMPLTFTFLCNVFCALKCPRCHGTNNHWCVRSIVDIQLSQRPNPLDHRITIFSPNTAEFRAPVRSGYGYVDQDGLLRNPTRGFLPPTMVIWCLPARGLARSQTWRQELTGVICRWYCTTTAIIMNYFIKLFPLMKHWVVYHSVSS